MTTLQAMGFSTSVYGGHSVTDNDANAMTSDIELTDHDAPPSPLIDWDLLHSNFD